MAVIALTSAAGAPGVTTAAVALTMTWPEPALLIEADTSKASSIIPGRLRGQVFHDKGLTEAAVAHQRRALTPNVLAAQTIELAEDCALVPGFNNLRGGATADASFWQSLLEAVQPYRSAGYDILVDLGRLRVDDRRLPLLVEADSVTLLTDRTLPGVAAALQHWRTRHRDRPPTPEWLLAALEGVGHEHHVDLVTVDRPIPQETWSTREIAAVLGMRVLGTLPWDPRGAVGYALGTQAPARRSAYSHAVSGLLHAYHDTLDARGFAAVAEREGQR